MSKPHSRLTSALSCGNTVLRRLVTHSLLLALLILVLTAPALGQGIADRLEGNLVEFLPSSEGAVPGIVAIPRCSGISLNSPATDRGGGSPTDPYFRRHYPRMAKALRDEDYAVFLVDSQSTYSSANLTTSHSPKPAVHSLRPYLEVCRLRSSPIPTPSMVST